LDDESDGHGRPRFRLKFPKQGPSSTAKFNQKRVFNLKSQEDGSEILLPGCSKCDRINEGECLAGSNVCFGCGELGHMSIALRLLEIKRIVVVGPNPTLPLVQLV